MLRRVTAQTIRQFAIGLVMLAPAIAVAQQITPPPGGGSGGSSVCASSPGAGTNGYVLEATSSANPPTCTWEALAGGGTVTTTGSPAQYQVSVFSSSSAITGVGPGAANAPLLGGGASANPAFSSILYLASLTSGGVVCGTSTTQLASSAALTSNVLLKGGGAGACPGNSLATDNGTTLSYSGTGGLTASAGPIQSTSDGTHAGIFGAVGNTTAPTIPSNFFGFIGPNSASFTSYVFQPNGTAPSGTQFVTVGTPSSNVSALNYVSSTGSGNVVLATSPTLVTPALGTPASGVMTNVTGLPIAAIVNGTQGGLLAGGGTGSAPQVSAAGTAKQIALSGGTGAPTFIDFPERYMIPAANCNNATAGAGWSIGSGGTVTCRAGTNNLGGFVSITDTSSTFAQFQLSIPADWDTSTDPYILFALQAATDTTNGHTIIPQIQISCPTATNGTVTDDHAFAAAHSATTITLGSSAVAHGFYTTSVQMNSTDMSGCVAGGMMIVQVGRATDTATGVIGFEYADVTFPRLLAVQAN